MQSSTWIMSTSYGLGAATFLIFAALLLIPRRQKHPLRWLLFWSSMATSLWMLLLARQPFNPHISWHIVTTGEALFDLSWLLLLARLITGRRGASPWKFLPTVISVLIPMAWLASTFMLAHRVSKPFWVAHAFNPQSNQIMGGLVIAIISLVMLEQVWRNVVSEDRWALKHLCIAIGVQQTYELLLYSEGMLYHEINPILWVARGGVFALTVPLLMVAFFRTTKLPNNLLLSRRIIFHSTTLVGAGIYLLVVAGGGYYIRYLGGSWGSFWETLFVMAATILLLVLLVSEQIRSRIRVLLAKNFFAYKYDYREEWNRLINRLYRHSEADPLPYERVIRAAAEIVDSPAGALWTRLESSPNFRLATTWNLSFPNHDTESFGPEFIDFMASRNWIIDADDHHALDNKHSEIDVPSWLKRTPNWWLVIPLRLETQLFAILVLARPRAPRTLSWEDRDLLKAVGQQLAAYLAQYEANQSLLQARQFQAVHQLSMFLMHDLKNLIAQQSLLLNNAAKHKHNPAFIDDMIATIEDSVRRMTRTLTQLRGGETAGFKKPVLVEDLVREAVHNCHDRQPAPMIELGLNNKRLTPDPRVLCDPHALANVLIHLIRNAQDATPDNGNIQVKVNSNGQRVSITVIDNGEGMSPQFIRDRLFKPFDTTKSARGMGIGAYQVQSFAKQYGGDVEVKSIPGHGTQFQLWLPQLPESLPVISGDAI